MPGSSDYETLERCPRKLKWEKTYLQSRIKPLEAIYKGVEAGLEGKDARDAVMALAADPGLDLEGVEVYPLAVHYSALAEILAFYLMAGQKPWTRVGQVWESGDELRRIVLVDRWSEERKMQEIRSWRTVAETCKHNRPMLLNFLVVGSSSDQRRVSPWTRGYSHPKNNGLQFRKKDGESLGPGWEPVWRERWQRNCDRWLAVMQRDGVFDGLVHSVRVQVPPRRDEFLADMARLDGEIADLPENPPMRRGGCYRFGACQYVGVCHAQEPKTPGECGWIALSDVLRADVTVPEQRNCAVGAVR